MTISFFRSIVRQRKIRLNLTLNKTLFRTMLLVVLTALSAVLDQNKFEFEPEHASESKAILTVVDGRIVCERQYKEQRGERWTVV